MSKNRIITGGLMALALVSLVALQFPEDCLAVEQGWAQIQSIQKGSRAATLNALTYDGKQVWIVGGDGLVLKSEDYGRTFQEIESKLDTNLNDIYIRGRKMWIIGDGGKMLLSTDGGQSFVKNVFISHRDAKSLPLDLYSVTFSDDKNGFIVGDQGLILASTDGGTSWREQPSRT
ncbi:MAG TPA: YCF48-related protein, partial [Blastocatellia bacterium]|nr:YCF48-related protein [Blastocatellia bacterium]